MKDKLIGLVMIFGSLSILVFMLLWTIIFPIIWQENFFFKAYLGLAITFFIIIFIALVFIMWVGWVFLKTRAPKEGMLEDKIKNNDKN